MSRLVPARRVAAAAAFDLVLALDFVTEAGERERQSLVTATPLRPSLLSSMQSSMSSWVMVA